MAVNVDKYDDVLVFQFGPVLTWNDLIDLHSYTTANLYSPPDHWRHRLVDLRQTWKIEINYEKMNGACPITQAHTCPR